MTWDRELERATERNTTRGFRQPPRLPTLCPGFLGGFPLGVKANAEAAVWRGHAANTTHFFRPGYEDSRRGANAVGTPAFSRGGSSVASTGYRPVHSLLVLVAEDRRGSTPLREDYQDNAVDCLVPDAVAFGRTGCTAVS